MELVEELSFMYHPDCFEDVLYRYQDTVYRIAFTYCRSTTEAEDIAQEVFIKYLTKAPHLTGEEHLKAWLIRVTINSAKSYLRSSWFKKTVPLSEQECHVAEDSTNCDVYSAIMALPKKYRTVVILYYFEDYTVREIAKILNRTETAIQTQLQRARGKLKEELKEDWINE
jgi:RNA polymerase sigma-70 factor (ECF subfamily)